MKVFIFIRNGEGGIKIPTSTFSMDKEDVGVLGNIIEKHNGKIKSCFV